MTGKDKTFCLRCLIEDLGDEELAAVLREGIEMIPQEHQVSREIYERRLDACRKCDHLVNGLCKFCGCFVEMRAMKKRGSCPDPDGSRWNEKQ